MSFPLFIWRFFGRARNVTFCRHWCGTPKSPVGSFDTVSRPTTPPISVYIKKPKHHSFPFPSGPTSFTTSTGYQVKKSDCSHRVYRTHPAHGSQLYFLPPFLSSLPNTISIDCSLWSFISIGTQPSVQPSAFYYHYCSDMDENRNDADIIHLASPPPTDRVNRRRSNPTITLLLEPVPTINRTTPPSQHT